MTLESSQHSRKRKYKVCKKNTSKLSRLRWVLPKGQIPTDLGFPGLKPSLCACYWKCFHVVSPRSSLSLSLCVATSPPKWHFFSVPCRKRGRRFRDRYRHKSSEVSWLRLQAGMELLLENVQRLEAFIWGMLLCQFPCLPSPLPSSSCAVAWAIWQSEAQHIKDSAQELNGSFMLFLRPQSSVQ